MNNNRLISIVTFSALTLICIIMKIFNIISELYQIAIVWMVICVLYPIFGKIVNKNMTFKSTPFFVSSQLGYTVTYILGVLVSVGNIDYFGWLWVIGIFVVTSAMIFGANSLGVAIEKVISQTKK